MAKSLDGGKTWTAVPYPTPFSNLVIDQNGTLFGGAGGVYTSTDEGSSWSNLGGGNADALAVIRDGWLLTVSYNLMDCYCSTDKGQTWTKLSAAPGRGRKLLYDSKNTIVYLMAGAYMGGGTSLYSSRDNGESWSNLCCLGQYAYPSSMAVDSTGRLWIVDRKNDGNNNNNNNVLSSPTFESEGRISPFTFALNVHDPATLLSGGDKGFRISRDGGRTWTTNNSGMSDTWLDAIGILPGGTVLAGTAFGMIYRSKMPIPK